MISDGKQDPGIVRRCERFPLMPGDTFTLFERRIYGSFCEAPEAATPGTFEIVDAVGADGRLLQLRKLGWEAIEFFCQAETIREILLNSYCNYQRGDQ